MLLRDRLLKRMVQMGPTPDYPRLAAEVLCIRNAPADLARRLVSQALVIEDRRDAWRRVGERVAARAPTTPGVYVLKDADGRPLYVGKAVNLRRRLRSHFAARRWRGVKAEFARAVDGEWQEVGSELEALLREAALIADLRPTVNVQVGAPALETRDIPKRLVRDVVVVLPSAAPDSAELVAARADGGWMIQRTRRNGADLAVHARRVWRFFRSALRRGFDEQPLAPIVFSWLAQRGESATRLDPHDAGAVSELTGRLRVLLSDDRLFAERIVVR